MLAQILAIMAGDEINNNYVKCIISMSKRIIRTCALYVQGNTTSITLSCIMRLELTMKPGDK